MAAKPSSDERTGGSPTLVPIGAHAGKPSLALTRTATLIGSGDTCHLHLLSSTVSNHHALLIYDTRGAFIRDLASRTKVIVNNKPVRESQLTDGDEIRIGKFLFKFQSDHPGAIEEEDAAIVIDVTGEGAASVPGRVALIGRRSNCDVAILQQSVSTRHAIIYRGKGKYYIRDLESRTGTFVNRKKVHRREIHPGDKIEIGDAEMKIVFPKGFVEPAALSESAISLDTLAVTSPEDLEPLAPLEPQSAESQEEPAGQPLSLTAAAVEDLEGSGINSASAAGQGVTSAAESAAGEEPETAPTTIEQSTIEQPEIEPEPFTVIEAPPAPPSSPEPEFEPEPEPIVAQVFAPEPPPEPIPEPIMPPKPIAPAVTAPEPEPESSEPPVLDLEETEEVSTEEALAISSPKRGRPRKTEPKPTARFERTQAKRIPPAPITAEAAPPQVEVLDAPIPAPKPAPVVAPVARPAATAPAIIAMAPPPPEIDLSKIDMTAPARPAAVADDVIEPPRASEAPLIVSGLNLQSRPVECRAGPVELNLDTTPLMDAPVEAPPPSEPVAQPIAGLEIRAEDFPAPVRGEAATTRASAAMRHQPVEPAEPSPGATLDLDSELPLPAATNDATDEVAADALGDSQFGRDVEAFSGESTGPLVEGPIDSDTTYDLPPVAEHTATVDANVVQGDDQAITDSISRVPLNFGIDVLPPELTHQPPPEGVVGEDHITDVQPLDPTAQEGSGAIDGSILDPLPPVTAPLTTVSSEESSEEEAPMTVLSGVGGLDSPSVNVDHFLGGMPVQLREISDAPDEPVHQSAAPAVENPRPAGRAPAQRRGPFASDPFDISPDDVGVMNLSEDGPAPKGVGSKGERLTTAFDGLAYGGTQQRDVFSHFDAPAAPDTTFGPAVGAEEAIPESPKSAAGGKNRIEGRAADRPVGTGITEPNQENRSGSSAIGATPGARVVRRRFDPLPEATAAPDDEIETATVRPRTGAARRPPAPYPPAPKRDLSTRRRRFIRFLMLAMLIMMAAAVTVILYFFPPHSHVVGALTYQNFNWVANTTDGDEFESAQKRLLEADQTRLQARDLLMQQHPSTPAGFLGSPVQYQHVAASETLSAARGMTAQTTMKLDADGIDEEGDRQRMAALLASMIKANAPVLDDNRRARDAADRARSDANDASQILTNLKSNLAAQKHVADRRPTPDEFAAASTRRLALQEANRVAEDAVVADRAVLARLQMGLPGDALEAMLASTRPDVPNDPALAQLRQEMADLSAKLDAARASQAAGAVETRTAMENALKEFNDAIQKAQTLSSAEGMAKFMQRMRDSQPEARNLVTKLIADGEDLARELENARRAEEDLIQTRLHDKWAADPALQELIAKRDSADHRYNAAVGEGVKDDSSLDALKRQVSDLNDQIKVRQGELTVDPRDVTVSDEQTKTIEALQAKARKDEKEIGEVLNPLSQDLKTLAPVVAGLPKEQQDLAQELADRISDLADAPQHYAATVTGGEQAPSAKVVSLQQQIAQIQANYNQKQQELSRQSPGTQNPAHAAELAAAQKKLEADKKAQDQAKHAYDAARDDYEEQDIRNQIAQTADAKIEELNGEIDSRSKLLEIALHDRDQKQARADRSFDIKSLGDEDITSAASDPRRDYCLYSIAGLAVTFAVWTLIATRAESSRRRSGALFVPPDGLTAREGELLDPRDLSQLQRGELEEDDDQETAMA